MTLLRHGEQVAGGLLTLFHEPTKTAHLRYLALNRDLPGTFHPPYPLFWEAVNHAYERGFRKVHFGPGSRDQQRRSVQIKRAFGCQFEDIYGGKITVNRRFHGMCSVYRLATKKPLDWI